MLFWLFIDIPLKSLVIQSNTSTFTFGTYIGLTCQAISRPVSTLWWTKDSVRIASSGNIKITYSVPFSNYTTAQSVLIITGLTQSNNGQYQCVGNYSKTGSVILSSGLLISK